MNWRAVRAIYLIEMARGAEVQPSPGKSGTNRTVSNVCSRIPVDAASMTVSRCTPRSPSPLLDSGSTMRPAGFR